MLTIGIIVILNKNNYVRYSEKKVAFNLLDQ